MIWLAQPLSLKVLRRVGIAYFLWSSTVYRLRCFHLPYAEGHDFSIKLFVKLLVMYNKLSLKWWTNCGFRIVGKIFGNSKPAVVTVNSDIWAKTRVRRLFAGWYKIFRHHWLPNPFAKTSLESGESKSCGPVVKANDFRIICIRQKTVSSYIKLYLALAAAVAEWLAFRTVIRETRVEILVSD